MDRRGRRGQGSGSGEPPGCAPAQGGITSLGCDRRLAMQSKRRLGGRRWLVNDRQDTWFTARSGTQRARSRFRCRPADVCGFGTLRYGSAWALPCRSRLAGAAGLCGNGGCSTQFADQGGRVRGG
jgi:hypothetical protein